MDLGVLVAGFEVFVVGLGVLVADLEADLDTDFEADFEADLEADFDADFEADLRAGLGFILTMFNIPLFSSS